jgi:hypothetical protein
MTPAIIIPWRGGDPDREAAAQYVEKWVAQTGMPWMQVDVASYVTFSRAASKNYGAHQANWADVLIFNDADMIITHQAYRDMAEMAYDSGKLVIGYVEYCALDKPHSQRIYRGDFPDPFDAPRTVSNVAFSLGGIIAVRRDVFAEVGGYDERFKVWGNEDWAFAISCATVAGPWLRIEGPALHFFHEHATLYVDEDQLRANTDLLGRYNQIKNLDGLREVQRLT